MKREREREGGRGLVMPFLGWDALPQETTRKALHFSLWYCLREHDDDDDDDDKYTFKIKPTETYYVYYLITPWSRVLLAKLSGLQLVKKFPAFYGTRRFTTAFTSVRHLSLSWASSIQSITPHPTSWRSILISSSHLRLGLPSVMYIITLLSWERSFRINCRFVSYVWITYFCTSYIWTLTYKLLFSLPNT